MIHYYCLPLMKRHLQQHYYLKKLDIRVLKIVWSIDYEYLIVIGLDSSITSYLVKDNFEKLSVIHPPTRFKTFVTNLSNPMTNLI